MIEGWRRVSVGDLGKIVSGGTPDSTNPAYWDGDIPWATQTDITNLASRYISSTARRITGAGLKSSSARLVPPGSILVCTRATIGELAIASEPICTNQGFKNLITNSEHDNEFVFYLLRFFKNYLVRYASGSTFLELTKKDFEKLVFVVPPLSEQRKIAKILSTWDKAIEMLERLASNTQDQKKALMQKLLSGKIRLSGYSKPWNSCQLDQIGSFTKGKGIRRDQVADSGFPCVLYGEIYTRHNDYIRKFFSFIDPTIAKTSQKIKQGDLLFAGSGETAEEIGKCVAYLGDEQVYAGSDIIVLSPEREVIDSKFLVYLMNWGPVATRKARFGQGNSVVHISINNLGKVELFLPDIDEQRAISGLLSEMDEIAINLGKQLDRIKLEKQALALQLLTGKRRVEIEKTSSSKLCEKKSCDQNKETYA